MQWWGILEDVIRRNRADLGIPMDMAHFEWLIRQFERYWARKGLPPVAASREEPLDGVRSLEGRLQLFEAARSAPAQSHGTPGPGRALAN